MKGMSETANRRLVDRCRKLELENDQLKRLIDRYERTHDELCDTLSANLSLREQYIEARDAYLEERKKLQQLEKQYDKQIIDMFKKVEKVI